MLYNKEVCYMAHPNLPGAVQIETETLMLNAICCHCNLNVGFIARFNSSQWLTIVRVRVSQAVCQSRWATSTSIISLPIGTRPPCQWSLAERPSRNIFARYSLPWYSHWLRGFVTPSQDWSRLWPRVRDTKTVAAPHQPPAAGAAHTLKRPGPGP